MRRLVVAEFMTLDGVMGLRGVPEEWDLFEAAAG